MNIDLIKGTLRFGLIAGLVAGLPTIASATLIAPNGSFSGDLSGGSVTTTFAGGGAWELGVTTTQIQITSGTRFVAGDADPYAGKTNNLLSTNGGPVSIGDPITIPISTYNIVTGSVTPFTVSFGGLAFTLTQEVVTSVSDGNIGLAFVGTLTGDASGTFILGDPADFSIGLTESSQTGAIGVSYSIDTPLNPVVAEDVPEPDSLAILGVGLLGMVTWRRKSVG